MSAARWGSRAAIAAALVVAAAVGLREARPPPPSKARALGMFSPDLPSDTRAEAEAALASEARLREERFLEAVEPGRAFASTRATEDEIEAGRFSPAEIFEIGAQLFHHTFTRPEGYGARDLPPFSRFHTGRRGGPDAFRCDTCHWRGGPAGAGDAADDAYLDGDGNTQSSTLARNPIALTGDGIVEILAREMSADLARARRRGAPLESKGVSFGEAGRIEGVDADLVIKPFGWKGNLVSIRDAVEDSLLVHHGMESDHYVSQGSAGRAGPFGGLDPDGDAVASEITEGQLTALTLFVAMQEVPVVATPESQDFVDLLAEGRNRFDALGCGGCHVPSLPLGSTVFRLPSRTGGRAITVDLAAGGAAPRIAPEVQGGGYRAWLYSDLKRHEMGPALAEPRADRGVEGRMWITRPLWGVARSRPYLHDGRAATLEDAILRHGGEAQGARDGYAALQDSERGALRVFLTSLTRARRLVTR